jgi:hypothetical protein
MDHTLFDLLGHRDGGVWHEKASFLRAREGMALMLTHPDYLHDKTLREYERFLEAFAGDETLWRALPREVSAWWRRRAASRIIRGDGGWAVEGPAADEARIELGAPARVRENIYETLRQCVGKRRGRQRGRRRAASAG